jgi:hypothetical protein
MLSPPISGTMLAWVKSEIWASLDRSYDRPIMMNGQVALQYVLRETADHLSLELRVI